MPYYFYNVSFFSGSVYQLGAVFANLRMRLQISIYNYTKTHNYRKQISIIHVVLEYVCIIHVVLECVYNSRGFRICV